MMSDNINRVYYLLSRSLPTSSPVPVRSLPYSSSATASNSKEEFKSSIITTYNMCVL